MMPDGAGRLSTSLGRSPVLPMACKRLPVFRSDTDRSAVVPHGLFATWVLDPDGHDIEVVHKS